MPWSIFLVWLWANDQRQVKGCWKSLQWTKKFTLSRFRLQSMAFLQLPTQTSLISTLVVLFSGHVLQLEMGDQSNMSKVYRLMPFQNVTLHKGPGQHWQRRHYIRPDQLLKYFRWCLSKLVLASKSSKVLQNLLTLHLLFWILNWWAFVLTFSGFVETKQERGTSGSVSTLVSFHGSHGTRERLGTPVCLQVDLSKWIGIPIP